MELIKTTGVVIRRTQVKDNDLILTLFTKDYGVIKASARGARGFKNRLAAGTALFAYSEFVLYPGREMYKVNSCELIESFYSLTTNIERLAFATYVADLTGYTVQEEADADTERLLSLFLNTFYLFARWGGDLRLVKCVFELKLLAFLGLMPCLTECMACGGEAEHYLSPASGGLVCDACCQHAEDARPISAACLDAMCYVFDNDDKKAFAFRLSQSALEELEGHVAALLSEYIDHDFFSLDYLNTVLGK